MRDIVVLSVTIVAFALLVTVHCAIAFGLVQRRPRSRALIALVAVPLAPYWAWRERMTFRAGLWIASAIVYAVAIWVGRH